MLEDNGMANAFVVTVDMINMARQQAVTVMVRTLEVGRIVSLNSIAAGVASITRLWMGTTKKDPLLMQLL